MAEVGLKRNICGISQQHVVQHGHIGNVHNSVMVYIAKKKWWINGTSNGHDDMVGTGLPVHIEGYLVGHAFPNAVVS